MTHHQEFEHHEHTGSAPCKVCASSFDHEHKASVLGVCNKCIYKILIVVLIVMITISYVAWFGVF